jgi:hypothetical protein
MTTHERHQLAEESSTMASMGGKYRVIGNILVFTGYFIGLAYLLMLYIMAFSLEEGAFNFWEQLIFPSWPWLFTAFLSITAGSVFIVIGTRHREHENVLKRAPEATRRDPVPPQLHTPVEQPVEL